MKRLAILFIAVLTIALQPLQAQRRDSVYTASEQFRWQKLVVPGALMGTGILATASPWYRSTVNIPVSEWAQRVSGGVERSFDNVLQYAPYGAYALGALIGCGEHGMLEQVLSVGTSVVLTAIVSGTMKEVCGVLRPNGADRKSFPSGHTCTVFLGAELVRLEFGPWWGLAAYSTAFVTAFMRVYNNWHWTSDLLAGAALGILGAHVGYWLLPLERKLLGVDSKQVSFASRASAMPFYSPTPAGACYGISLAYSF
ncbi:MAG: phosphatase PAP2 family protein [Bacteroidales bacterium]|nr:phosphatase PAP2 family protein [Bacteroidales bacterium]